MQWFFFFAKAAQGLQKKQETKLNCWDIFKCRSYMCEQLVFWRVKDCHKLFQVCLPHIPRSFSTFVFFFVGYVWLHVSRKANAVCQRVVFFRPKHTFWSSHGSSSDLGWKFMKSTLFMFWIATCLPSSEKKELKENEIYLQNLKQPKKAPFFVQSAAALLASKKGGESIEGGSEFPMG